MPDASIPRASYAAPVLDFLTDEPDGILGALTRRSAFAVDETQRDAWQVEIDVLKRALSGVAGTVFLEFDVPRIGSRIDAVLVAGSALFVIEFKVGQKHFTSAAFDQAWDYALDLKNFHQASHGLSIFPVVVATDAAKSERSWQPPASDSVYRPAVCNAAGLQGLIQQGLESTSGRGAIDGFAWAAATYQPTPTIIEAARALYANHSVDAIARHDAGARNLRITSARVSDVIESSRTARHKSIVFVTGVPGAGKTLVGLNIATAKRATTPAHAVFLSGNGPLVKVLREALTVDELQRLRAAGTRARKGDVQQKVKAFIQNVHHFRDEGLNHDAPPHDRVVIFDEAQRAWNREMTTDFMKRKKGRAGFTQSEPEFLLSYLDRHKDWAVVICLVGGGQEINRGEAGIAAWLDAIAARFTHWCVYISPSLSDSEYAAGQALDLLGAAASVVTDDSLHLATSMRSFRAEHVSRFVKAVLDHDADGAAGFVERLKARYPIALTRNLESARRWIRERARGSERYGLVASSKARRLKPDAVDVRYEVDPVQWFLSDRDDTRSSYYLEDAATEFQVQGLELDWVCVAWDADLRFDAPDWNGYRFEARGWRAIRKEHNRAYLRNAYRVLLTRARQGMVIYVPKGESRDWTRLPALYDGTFDYLRSLGLTLVE